MIFYLILFRLTPSQISLYRLDARIEPRTFSMVELSRSRLDLTVVLLIVCVLVRENKDSAIGNCSSTVPYR
jgi:hypothetical protein